MQAVSSSLPLEKSRPVLPRRRGSRDAVEIFAGLHHGDHAALGSLGADGLVDFQRGGIHGAIGGAAVEDDIYAGGLQFLTRKERRLAELRDIGQDGNAYGHADLGIHCLLRHRFGKDHIRPAAT